MVRYAQRAEALGFDSVWVPDHFFFQGPPGVLTPYPEAWTLMTAIGVTTERVQIGSMVLAAAFRHPALLAEMAGALQESSAVDEFSWASGPAIRWPNTLRSGCVLTTAWNASRSISRSCAGCYTTRRVRQRCAARLARVIWRV
jgi:hypothetical protein